MVGKDKKKQLKWGVRQGQYFVINSRMETIKEKGTRMNRCVVPVSGYYEWKDKQPYYYHPQSEDVMHFAGLFNKEEGFTIVTKSSQGYPKLAEIHDRMPFVLTEKQTQEWLDGEQLDSDKVDLERIEVGPYVSDIKNKSAACIQKVKPQPKITDFFAKSPSKKQKLK